MTSDTGPLEQDLLLFPQTWELDEETDVDISQRRRAKLKSLPFSLLTSSVTRVTLHHHLLGQSQFPPATSILIASVPAWTVNHRVTVYDAWCVVGSLASTLHSSSFTISALVSVPQHIGSPKYLLTLVVTQ